MYKCYVPIIQIQKTVQNTVHLINRFDIIFLLKFNEYFIVLVNVFCYKTEIELELSSQSHYKGAELI